MTRESILAEIEVLWVRIRSEREEAKKHGIPYDSHNINKIFFKMDVLEERLMNLPVAK